MRGMLMILANAAAGDEAEFNRWYDREHMAERVAIPGFLSARRYAALGDGRWRYLALYETVGIATFTGDSYRAALGSQTAWSRRMLGRFRDPQRSVAVRTAHAGYGVAGAVALTRLVPASGAAGRLRRHLAETALPGLAGADGAIAASLLESEPTLSGPVAEYPEGGLEVVRPDDWLVLAGAVAPEALPQLSVPPELAAEVEPLGRFALMWDLHRDDLPQGDA